MRPVRWAGGLLVLVLGLSACARLAPVFRPAPWDGYGDSGPLRVRGADRDAPGPTIVRALRSDPDLTPVFARHGEPDNVEVYGGRYEPKDIALVYRRSGHRIVVVSTGNGWYARSPEALPDRRRRAAAQPAARTAEVEHPGPPTMAQTLECPIDPMRADCTALCVSGAKHEWCP